MISIFKPPPHIDRLPQDRIDPVYRRMRLQVFAGIFIGYAGYYLVRKNFSLAAPYLIEEHGYNKTQIGFALSGVAVAYGLSKFLMGSISDRSNPRWFMAAGLIASAAIMLAMGCTAWATAGVGIMFALMLANGWFQGMGWPPSGRTLVHWFSENERGTKTAAWNIAHNVGGGLIGPLATLGLLLFGDWRSLFYFPALIAIALAAFIMLTLRDTPQSVGLPPIEDHRHDHPKNYQSTHEQEFTARQIFLEHVLNNRYLWFIAIANAFVYLVRYGVLDWAPTYLQEAKSFDPAQSGWAYFAYEYAGIPGTLLCGWMSDRVFHGRRAPAGVLFMALVLAALLVYWLNPPGRPWIDVGALIAIGFLIYGPVMLIGLFALDLAPKKAAGTAAGFTGMFGYLGGTLSANIAVGAMVDYMGWKGGFILLVAACVLSILFLSLVWNQGASVEEASPS